MDENAGSTPVTRANIEVTKMKMYQEANHDLG